MKVCAGDYGETKWRGICDSLFDSDGYITASSTRMNEYYLGEYRFCRHTTLSFFESDLFSFPRPCKFLEFDGEDAKQYTMCHGTYMQRE